MRYVLDRNGLLPENRLGVHEVLKGAAGLLPFPVIDPLNKA